MIRVKLKSHIKCKRAYWKLIPSFYALAQTIKPNIYLPDFVYDDLSCGKPNLHYLALLAHEEEHLRVQNEIGLAKFLCKYFLSRPFRFEEELRASVIQLKLLKTHGQVVDIDKKARFLSSWVYLFPISFREAKIRLEKELIL